MNEKQALVKTFKIFYIAIFLILLILPLFQMSSNIFDLPKLNEKRAKTERPALTIRSLNKDFIKKFEDYFNDNYGFRDSLIMLNNGLDLKLFNIASSSKVLVGKNDYLYSTEELEDYNKTKILKDADIDKIAKKLYVFQNELEKRGIYFLFTIAPNKSTIYPEYMPYESKNKDIEGNYDKLQKKIESLGINTIDFRTTLMENKSKYNLYYKRDTHWNDYGSFLATEELLKKLSQKFTLNSLPKIRSKEEHIYEGDLDGLLGVKSWIKDYKLDIDYGDTSVKLPKMICYVDSFSYNLLPKLNEYSSNRIDNHNLNAEVHSNLPLYIRNTKILYFEIVERYIPKLLDYDFDVFDNDIKNIDLNLYTKLNLPLLENDKIKIHYEYIEKAKNADGSTYIGSAYQDSFIYWYLDKKNIDYLYLELKSPPKNIKSLQIFWSNDKFDFNEEESVKFVISPIKTKYLIDLREFSLKNITRFRLDIGEEPHIDLDINSLEIYTK